MHEIGLENEFFVDHEQELWDMPFPPQTPSKGRSVVDAQLNAPKLMNFLAMPTTDHHANKVKRGSSKTLRSFLNNEMAVNLESLKEAPIKIWPQQEPMKEQPPAVIAKNSTTIDEDPKSLFRLRINTLGDYFEGDDSNAVLPIVCKGNTVMAVLDGGAGVSIVAK